MICSLSFLYKQNTGNWGTGGLTRLIPTRPKSPVKATAKSLRSGISCPAAAWLAEPMDGISTREFLEFYVTAGSSARARLRNLSHNGAELRRKICSGSNTSLFYPRFGSFRAFNLYVQTVFVIPKLDTQALVVIQLNGQRCRVVV